MCLAGDEECFQLEEYEATKLHRNSHYWHNVGAVRMRFMANKPNLMTDTHAPTHPH